MFIFDHLRYFEISNQNLLWYFETAQNKKTLRIRNILFIFLINFVNQKEYSPKLLDEYPPFRLLKESQELLTAMFYLNC